MSTAADTPPAEPSPLVDWSKYAHDVRLVESEHETGAVPAAVPDRLHLDGVSVEMERSSWSIGSTGSGVATVTASVRRRDVQVARHGGASRPRVYIGGVRVLATDSAAPDTDGSPNSWVSVRFCAPHIRVVPLCGQADCATT